MGVENRFEDICKEGNRSFGKTFNALFGILFGPGFLLTLRPS